MIDFQQMAISFLCGGGAGYAIVKTLVRSEARAELKDDIRDLHDRSNLIEKDFVRCEFCKLQHDTLTATLTSMDKKLDILIEKQ